MKQYPADVHFLLVLFLFYSVYAWFLLKYGSTFFILFFYFIFYLARFSRFTPSITILLTILHYLQADQICYAVLCVFSYIAAGQEQKKTQHPSTPAPTEHPPPAGLSASLQSSPRKQ